MVPYDGSMRARFAVLLASALGTMGAACELIAGIQDVTEAVDAGDAGRGRDAGRDATNQHDAGGDALADVTTLPCKPTAGAGTLCATVGLDPGDPPLGYEGLIGGVSTLRINGKGALVVFLFNMDPTGGCNPYVNITPITTIQIPAPAQPGELSVDQLPVTAVGTAPPGKYWVFAFFQDNGPPPTAQKLASRGTGINAPLPGDLVTPVASSMSAYPTVNLTAGTTTIINLKVHPLRGLLVDMQPASTLLSEAKSDKSVLGDGPASVLVFDSDAGLGPGAVFLDFAAIPCVNLKLQGTPTSQTVLAGVQSTGKHLLYCNIYDYAPPNVCGNPLPAGTIESAENGTPVDISTTSWTSSATVSMIGLGPFGSGADAGAPAMCH